MTSDFYFTATSWFPRNFRVKPYSKHSAPPPPQKKTLAFGNFASNTDLFKHFSAFWILVWMVLLSHAKVSFSNDRLFSLQMLRA